MTRAKLLWVLLALFALRVTGQLLVVAGLAPFLPPMEDWQSGLLPYPLLLASQILILAVLTAVCVQFHEGRDTSFVHTRGLRRRCGLSGGSMRVGMVVRYALLRRDAIPVVFHIVLASFSARSA